MQDVLSADSFMRWGQEQEAVRLELSRHRWEQGPLPLFALQGFEAEERKHNKKKNSLNIVLWGVSMLESADTYYAMLIA